MNLKIIITSLLLVFGLSAHAQEQATGTKPGSSQVKVVKDDAKVNEIYRVVEQMAKPEFDQSKYLAENLTYPEQAQENRVEGKVVVQFVVEKDGSLSDIKVIRGQELGNGIPEEAIRVIRKMPKWKPATQSGAPVRSYLTVPISFNLQ